MPEEGLAAGLLDIYFDTKSSMAICEPGSICACVALLNSELPE